MMRAFVPACLMVMTLILTGCSGLSALTRVSRPNELYMLTPKSTFDEKLPRIAQQIVIEEPTATAAVDTDQIAVQPTSLRVQYLPRARWVDRAPLIVQALLIESYENSNRVDAVGRSAVGLRADYLIVTDIREFQALVPASEQADEGLNVNVRLNIKVIDSDLDRIIGSRSFEEVVRSKSDDVSDVISAFDEALGDTMRDSVEWSVRLIHGHAIRNERDDSF